MSIIRHFVFAAGAALALVCQPAGAQDNAAIKWSLPSAYPADNFHNENLSLFAKDVAEATAGKLAITLHPGASLFSATQIKSAVRIGQAQAGEILISLHDGEDPIYGVDVIPFLATSYRDARKLWAASKAAIGKRFEAQGLTPLFAVPWPPQGIYAKKEIVRVADMRGLSWRVYNSGTQRIAQLVGAFPVTIQAADLPQALATGLINAFMTSSATGYDSKAWETMTYFYDTQAWIPKNVTFVNKAAFEQLDKPVRDAVLKASAAAEARGWAMSQDKTKWYADQLAARGMKVLAPSAELKAGLQKIGEQLTDEWLVKAGADGRTVIAAYRSGM
jgi:TRAP-type C4-dicarboxylate transport system substrate-binding protein